MTVRSVYTIIVNHDHCACFVICDHSGCATTACQSHHTITIYCTPHTSMYMYAVSTRLNRVPHTFCAGISALSIYLYFVVVGYSGVLLLLL